MRRLETKKGSSVEIDEDSEPVSSRCGEPGADRGVLASRCEDGGSGFGWRWQAGPAGYSAGQRECVQGQAAESQVEGRRRWVLSIGEGGQSVPHRGDGVHKGRGKEAEYQGARV